MVPRHSLLLTWLNTQGVSELTDRQGCAILALEVVPKHIIFA